MPDSIYEGIEISSNSIVLWLDADGSMDAESVEKLILNYKMIIFVDIDDTICHTEVKMDYENAKPFMERIEKINKLYDEGHYIKYWTARGSVTGLEWYDVTLNQLKEWGCKFSELSVGEKPDYDLLICDKTKRIEELWKGLI